MKLPSLLAKTKHPWQWPSCNHPSTHSFRAASDDIFKTVNSVFFDPVAANDAIETPDSWFTSSSESASFSAESEESGEDSLETIIHGARSERLFFEPGSGTSSIMENKATAAAAAPKDKQSKQRSPPPLLSEESVMVAVESRDPYRDFRQSMEEMVECHGARDWEWLEELLEWYLRMNGKQNHGFIVGAFIDLLVGLAPPDSSTSSSSDSATSFGSAVSSFSAAVSGPISFQDQDQRGE